MSDTDPTEGLAGLVALVFLFLAARAFVGGAQAMIAWAVLFQARDDRAAPAVWMPTVRPAKHHARPPGRIVIGALGGLASFLMVPDMCMAKSFGIMNSKDLSALRSVQSRRWVRKPQREPATVTISSASA